MLKRTHILMVGLLSLSLLPPAIAWSQTRRRSTVQRRGASSNARQPHNASGDARAEGASRVAGQIKLLSRFLYLYGRITNGFDVAAEASNRGETNAAATEQTEQSKAAVRQNLRNVREGLDDLEIRFRTTPELQRYYTSLAGVATSAVEAEEKAAANQFDQAGRALIEVINRLTNVLLEMR